MKKTFVILFIYYFLLSFFAKDINAQEPPIDLYINSWKNSAPTLSHGMLQEWAILTPGDPLNPKKCGAVLKYATKVSRGLLDGNTRTTSAKHPGQEEILFVIDGSGKIETGLKRVELSEGSVVVIPPDVDHIISNECEKPLEFLVLCGDYWSDKIPPGEIIVRNYHDLPLEVGHWSMNIRRLLKVTDGLGWFYAVNIITIDGMGITNPHTHGADYEEVWYALKNKSLLFLGKKIQWQEEGTAYMIPPTDTITHSNINAGTEPVMFLDFIVFPQQGQERIKIP